MFWITLALEAAILWLAIARGLRPVVFTFYVAFQLTWDLASLIYTPFLSVKSVSMIFWVGQGVLYLFQMAVVLSLFSPMDLVGIWLKRLGQVSAGLLVVGIFDQWLRLHGHGQYNLAAFAGVLVLFGSLTAFLAGEIKSWPIWAGITLWAASEAYFFYFNLPGWYTSGCAAALATVLVGEGIRFKGQMRVKIPISDPSDTGYHKLDWHRI
jgi:hypothetical protein